VTAPTTAGYIRIYPTQSFAPDIQSLSFSAGQTRANNAILGLGPDRDITVHVDLPDFETVHFIIDVNGYFQCLSDPHGDEYSQTVTLHYIDVDAISMSIFTSYDCGGAHPDFGDRPLTIDGRTGEELRLEDVMYVGTGAPPAYQPGGRNDAYFRYRDQVLAPWLAKTMKRLHPKDMPAVADDAGDCDYNQPSIWAFVNWHLRPDGIYVGPSFARALRACEYPDWSVLPWKVVRAHAGRIKLGADVAQ